MEKDYDRREENMSSIIVETIKQMISEIVQNNNEKIESIGLSFPGTVTDDTVIKTDNLGIYNFKMAEELKKDFNVPIKLCNDAKCAAIAEKKFGSLKYVDDALFLTIGTGLGGAAFLNGELLKPKMYYGFEVGHMVIEKDGKRCNCGRNGCFESYGSMRNLKLKISNEFNLKNINGKYIKEFIINNLNDKKLNKILDEYIEYLTIGIANLVNILEPEIISIGGSFTYYKEILLPKLEKKLGEKTELFNKDRVPKIVIAEFKNDAGIIGATII